MSGSPPSVPPSVPPSGDDLSGKRIGRFSITSRLGAGGMGEVYRASDTMLKRTVALKRLAPHLRSDADYHLRFLKEAERAAHLSHQGIAALYDVLDEQGELFLVMEYIEGRTLRARMEDPLSIQESVAIVCQTAEALAAAHEKGILHLDIKPENIMLSSSGRQAKVLDFGVARRLLSAEADAVTETKGSWKSQSVGGTPSYMAPEVLRSEDPDERADIFALGMVLYECLTGKHPFLTPSLMDTAGRILYQPETPVPQLNPRVPAELARIVAKMLAKDKNERYATTRDLLVDLRAVQRQSSVGVAWTETSPLPPQPVGTPTHAPRISRRVITTAVWIAAVVLVAVGVYTARKPLRRALVGSVVPAEKNVAVLPFSVTGGDEKIEAFSDGLIEMVTAKLTQLTRRQSLQVAPSSSVRERKVTATAVEKAGAELGVNLVITGGLQQEGDVLRVSVNLVDVRQRRQLRSEVFDADAHDPFAVQDRVVDLVVEMLELEPEPGERKALAARGTQVAAAEDAYLRGRGYLRNYDKAENIDRSIAAFQRAVDLDPRYSLAQAGLGSAYWEKFRRSKDSQWADKASAACREAVTLDKGKAQAHICLGTVLAGTGHYAEASVQFGQAADLEPTNDDAFRGQGNAYERLGLKEEAERTYRAAIDLRPGYWAGYSWLGRFYAMNGRTADAVKMMEKVVSIAPDSYRGYYNLGATYILEGRNADAIPLLERSLAIQPTAAAYSNLATAQFYLRRFADSVKNNEAAIRMGDAGYVKWGNLGDAYYYGDPSGRPKAQEAYGRAVELAQGELKVNPRDAVILGDLADFYLKLGQKDKAMASLKKALELGPQQPDVLFKAILVYNQLGDTQAALDWMDKALKAGFSRATIASTPVLDKLHDQPRFQALTR